ncbi:hypothetical protein MPSEU_000723600 [Mayamaea pseudoterrestris]|nr:hypothetical protein MPSEU_000723600 [Mayamaea pseudoterrestris]
MGQCSTLPAEARASSSMVSTRFDGAFQNSDEMRQEQKIRLNPKADGRREGLDFNRLIPEHMGNQNKHYSVKQHIDPFGAPECRHTEGTYPPSDGFDSDQMEIDESPVVMPVFIPQPPESAIRTRCYKLNLDSEINSISGTQKLQQVLGPFSEPPPQLTYSSSEDSSQAASPTHVAIKTAQIFRGITISRDGTILSQNARATRSSRGNKSKKGEKSRQAAKIDKANDLIEESLAGGVKAEDSEDGPPSLVSLYVIGEYDDMKHLVRDGSKKLRDAADLPEEYLFSINKPRMSFKSAALHSPYNSKKRESPSLVQSQRAAALQSPGKVQVTGTIVLSGDAHSVSQPTQQTPPRIKGHPRDTRPGRREDRASMRMRLDYCHPGTPGEDWSHAWNIWNCGGAGTVSPNQPSSPQEHTQVLFEGRDPAFSNLRESGVMAGRQ